MCLPRGSCPTPTFSHWPVAISSRYARASTDSLPTPCRRHGVVRRDHRWSGVRGFEPFRREGIALTSLVLRSILATPALIHHRRPRDCRPDRVRDRASPSGCSARIRRQRVVRDLAGLRIELADHIALPKSEYQACPSASIITSCGSASLRGRSYSVMTTFVARPFGRGSVLSSYSCRVRIVRADGGEVVGGLLRTAVTRGRSLRAPPARSAADAAARCAARSAPCA